MLKSIETSSSTLHIPVLHKNSTSTVKTDYLAYHKKDEPIIIISKDTLKARIEKIASVSAEVISSLKRTLDYNGYYIAYLLEQLSEDEFNKIAEEYAVCLSDKKNDDIVIKVKLLFRLSKESFSATDISNIFKIEENIAEEILHDLKNEKIINDSNSLSE